jgi:DNA-binding NarL/FixJ family response regulator
MKLIRVSIVEDDDKTRKMVADWIDSEKEFCCSGNHSSAESAFRSLANEMPDVVLMDINLPGISGVECVRQMKPILPQTQFIMVTVYEDTQHLFDALSAGASGYLLKKSIREDLLDSIRSVMHGGSPMTGSIARKVVQYFHAPIAADIQDYKLSPRENEVLGMLAKGFLYKEISDQLNISIATVNCHIRNIYEKMHVRSRAQAVAKYSKTESIKTKLGI